MLKKTIKYVDLDGNQREETYYFHLSKVELTEMELGLSGNGTKLSQYVQMIVEAQNEKELFRIVKEMVLLAYGQKTPDGRAFEKSEEAKHKFSNTVAFDELISELASDADTLSTFVNGLVGTISSSN